MTTLSYLEDLTCSLCLEIFTEPVSLSCGHSFCRECVTPIMTTLNCCPLCRETLPTKEQQFFGVNQILKNLAEKTKEDQKKRKEKKEQNKEDGGVAQWLCLEHEEKFKLFCVTDQQLACVICRDGQMHQGHTFKPIKEADASLRQELKKTIDRRLGDIQTAEILSKTQNEEITKTRDEARQLLSQITTQFKEMYQFLRKREKEIKKELEEKERDAVEKMSENLKVIETALSESRDMEVRLKSVLEIPDAEQFLQSWTENKTKTVTSDSALRSRASKLQVTSASVLMGPYESHMQFFVWKEMLQVITPLPERLTLKRESSNFTVSQDGRMLYTAETLNYSDPMYRSGYGVRPGPNRHLGGQSGTCVHSVQEFTKGQHYWEIDVGIGTSWELGIMNNYLKCNNQQYIICNYNTNTQITLTGTLSKVGVYLNCSSNELSFYNANDMRPIHTIKLRNMSMPHSAYLSKYGQSTDLNPLTVCWY